MRNWMLAITAAVGLLGWHGHGQAQTTLRFADTLSASDTHNEAARRMAERVKELTGGAIVISVHPAGELGNDNALLEGIRLGHRPRPHRKPVLHGLRAAPECYGPALPLSRP